MTALLATPSAASDFSALGKPEFARGLLLSVERRQEISCTRTWYLAKRTDLKPVATEIQDRLAIDIGSIDWAASTLDNSALDASGEDGITADWPSGPTLDGGRCDRLAAAFTKGGLAAAAPLLAPRAAGPIALPSAGFCLAQLERGKMAQDQPELARIARKLRAEVRRSRVLPAADHAAIARDHAAYSTTVPIPNWAALRGTEAADVICFPALSILSTQLHPER